MAQYIDKSALVAEIERIKNEDYYDIYDEYDGFVRNALDKVLSFIDSLGIKEMDLEEEINTYISNNFFGSQTIGFFANRTKEEPNDQDIALCAKHFFELGLKVAQKGE